MDFMSSTAPPGIIVGFNRIPLDMTLIENLAGFGFNLDYAMKCIEANRHNHLTTSYYLMLKKLVYSGGKSPAGMKIYLDINRYWF
jgi:5'-AMP-activated protein kinase catalytic alpha subunit